MFQAYAFLCLLVPSSPIDLRTDPCIIMTTETNFHTFERCIDTIRELRVAPMTDANGNVVDIVSFLGDDKYMIITCGRNGNA